MEPRSLEIVVSGTRLNREQLEESLKSTFRFDIEIDRAETFSPSEQWIFMCHFVPPELEESEIKKTLAEDADCVRLWGIEDGIINQVKLRL